MQAEAAELMRQAEAATAELASPVGMFKNLSPDLHSYIPDPRRIPRPGVQHGQINPGTMGMMRPLNLSKNAEKLVVANSKMSYKVPKGDDGFVFKGTLDSKSMNRSQLILQAKNKKREKEKKEEMELILKQREIQSGRPGGVKVAPTRPTPDPKKPVAPLKFKSDPGQ